MVSQLVDVVNKQTRSRMMAGIRSQNTKPEILTRSALHQRGYRFRLDSKVKIPGQKRKIKPDIVFNTSLIHSSSAIDVIHAAKSVSIATVAFVFSWDNLTSQGRIFPYYD